MKFTSHKRATVWANCETKRTGIWHEVKATRWLNLETWKWVYGYTVVLSH